MTNVVPPGVAGAVGATPPQSTPADTNEQQQQILKRIITKLTEEIREPRRIAIADAAESRAYWKGQQDGETGAKVSQADIDRIRGGTEEDSETYDYVLNFYQANGIVVMSPMAAAGVPPTQFIPENPLDPADVSTAQTASKIRDYLHRQKWFGSLQKYLRTLHLFYTDGLVLGYTRHVRDKAFGTFQRDKMGEVPQELRPAGYDCQACGYFEPRADIAADGLPCPKCGTPMQHAEAKTEIVTKVVGQDEIPKGREMVDVYGILEAILPPEADTIETCDYAGIEKEVHVAALRAAFPEMADKIKPEYGSGLTDDYARQARDRVDGVSAEGKSGETTTFTMVWLRPKMFYSLVDKGERDPLLAAFPDGCRVDFSGSLVLKVVPEKIEDHLTLGHCYPGDGMYKPSMGGSFKDPQRMTNDAVRIQQEAMLKHALSPVYRDSEMTGPGAVKKRARAGEDVPVKVPANKVLQNCVWQPDWKEPGQTVQQTIDLGERMGQSLTGAVAALAGDSMENMRTARGYAQATTNATMRLALPFLSAKGLWERIDEQLVHHFVENRAADEKTAYSKPAAQPGLFDVVEISLAEAQGKFAAYPETSESVPITSDQKLKSIFGLLQTGDQSIIAWLSEPRNLSIIKQVSGLRDLVVPGEDYRNRTLRIIAQLLTSAPMESPPQVDPMTGQVVQMPPQPTVALDPFLDDPNLVVANVRDWCVSGEGVRAERENPGGFQNVLAYGRAAQAQVQAILQAQAAAAQPGDGSSPTKSPGAPPEKSPLPPPGADQPVNPEEGAVQ